MIMKIMIMIISKKCRQLLVIIVCSYPKKEEKNEQRKCLILQYVFFCCRPLIIDTMTNTNLVVMVDDPIISRNMGEMLLQVQSGLPMGSRTGGVSTSPGGSVLLTSNSNVVTR